MLRDEFRNRVVAIGELEDNAEIRKQLLELCDEAEKDYTRRDELETENTSLKEKNEKLQDYNMQLFLRVGEAKDKKEQKKDTTGIDELDTPKKREFKDLFDEKGGIK